MGFHRGVVLAGCLLLAATSFAQERSLEITFESGNLGERWSAIRKITASRVPAPALTDQKGEDAPAGKALAIQSAANSGLFLKQGKGPSDWTTCGEVSFWAYRSPEEVAKHAASTIELQIYEADPGARFWRKTTLDHTGWKRISVPLKWFRWGSGRIPRWSKADRMGFWFRDETQLVLDTVRVSAGSEDRPAELSIEDLQSVAFPNASVDDITVIDSAEVLLLSDASKLDANKLVEHLAKVATTVREELALAKPAVKPVLIVFDTDAAYREFPPRLGEKLNSMADPPKSGGYALHGIASAAWSDQWGSLRPVYTHEFVHGLLARSSGIPNKQEWFQEGVANYYQIRFHPQDGLDKLILAGVRSPSGRSPLEELCSGRPISGTRYWQALTVVDFLRRDPRYSKHFPEMITEMGEKGTTDLTPFLASWKTSWEDLTAQWMEHCRKTYEPN
ncbi:MAG: hypothetical protein AAFX06_27390 [Planctomycetota bacterium]